MRKHIAVKTRRQNNEVLPTIITPEQMAIARARTEAKIAQFLYDNAVSAWKHLGKATKYMREVTNLLPFLKECGPPPQKKRSPRKT